MVTKTISLSFFSLLFFFFKQIQTTRHIGENHNKLVESKEFIKQILRLCRIGWRLIEKAGHHVWIQITNEK